jgi:uncharacterized protein
MPEHIRVDITATEHVTAIAYPASGERAGICVLLAHGAGANQSSTFMVRFASALAGRGFDAVTFNFLYSEQRRRVPDPNAKLELCWRQVIQAFHDGKLIKSPDRDKLVIGGKSMGGRIASQVAAAGPEGVAGLLLLGYPLHPPGHPEKPRSRHLPDIRVPMLFVQGSRDTFGTPEELRPVLARLNAPADLHVVDDGDHSFKVPKKAGLSQDEVYGQVLDTIAQWLRRSVVPAQAGTQ